MWETAGFGKRDDANSMTVCGLCSRQKPFTMAFQATRSTLAGGWDAAGPWWKGLSILSCHKLVSGVQEKKQSPGDGERATVRVPLGTVGHAELLM